MNYNSLIKTKIFFAFNLILFIYTRKISDVLWTIRIFAYKPQGIGLRKVARKTFTGLGTGSKVGGTGWLQVIGIRDGEWWSTKKQIGMKKKQKQKKKRGDAGRCSSTTQMPSAVKITWKVCFNLLNCSRSISYNSNGLTGLLTRKIFPLTL